MSPKNIEIGRAGRALRTIPRIRLVIHKPCMYTRRISTVNKMKELAILPGVYNAKVEEYMYNRV